MSHLKLYGQKVHSLGSNTAMKFKKKKNLLTDQNILRGYLRCIFEHVTFIGPWASSLLTAKCSLAHARPLDQPYQCLNHLRHRWPEFWLLLLNAIHYFRRIERGTEPISGTKTIVSLNKKIKPVKERTIGEFHRDASSFGRQHSAKASIHKI